MKEIKMKTEVDRPFSIPEPELKKHIEAIGKAIIQDAEAISKYRKVRSIDISASVRIAEEITTIEYTIERIADPRVFVKDGEEDG